MIGFFNMLIYVRPKVAKLRLQYPHISWIKAFFLIIKAAGREVPAINDTSSSNNSTNAFSRIFCCRGCCVSKHYDDISDLRPRHSEARPSDPRYSEALPSEPRYSEPDGGASVEESSNKQVFTNCERSNKEKGVTFANPLHGTFEGTLDGSNENANNSTNDKMKTNNTNNKQKHIPKQT